MHAILFEKVYLFKQKFLFLLRCFTLQKGFFIDILPSPVLD